jgi:cytoskeleton protein RodZ
VQSPTEQIPSAARVAQGPGAILRDAREAAGLERDALAARLRLEPKVIEAVETEAYERLPGPAFTKGYIRSIAKELGIDPTQALAQYTALANVAEPVLADFESRAPAQITSSSKRIQFISYALIAVVLVLIAVWWQRHYNSRVAPPDTGDDSLSSAPLIAPEPSIPLPYTFTIVEHAGAPLAQPETWRRQSDGSTPPAVDDTLPALDPAVTAAPPEAPTNGSTAPPVATANGELVLAAARDSWVEVTDLNRTRLHFGLIKGGERVAVTGKAPYDLVIGNAPAVTVNFRGAAVDVGAYAINGVARMAVGEP